MISLLHSPTTTKVYVAMAVAGVSLIGLWLIAIRIRADRKRDIYRPEVFRRELYAADDIEEIVVEGALPIPVAGEANNPFSAARIAFGSVLLAVFIVSGWFGYRTWTILQCWDKAVLAGSQHDFRAAEALCRKAIRIDPLVPKSHFLLGSFFLDDDRPEPAVTEFRLASRGVTGDPAALIALGDALQIVDRPAEALPAYQLAIELAPKAAGTYVRLGSCLVKVHRINDAVSELRYAIQLDPKNVKANTNLGAIYLAKGNTAEGLACLKLAVKLAPLDVAAHNQLGTGFAQCRMYAEAAAEFRSQLTIDPEYAVGYFNLAEALYMMHDNVGALDAYRSYLRKCYIHPEFRMQIPRAEKRIAMLSNKKG